MYAAAGGRKTGFFACAMPLAVLTMTKDIGFAYALIVTFLIGLDQLFGTPHPDTKPARIFGVSLAKCSILAAVVLAVFISWNRYTAAVTPTETTGASVGSAGLSYGAVLTGGIKQLLGIGREERFAQIMQSMGQAFLYRRVCLVGAPIMAVSCILLLFTAAFVAAPAGAARRRTVVGFVGGAFCCTASVCWALRWGRAAVRRSGWAVRRWGWPLRQCWVFLPGAVCPQPGSGPTPTACTPCAAM